jgi:hypothetical protein
MAHLKGSYYNGRRIEENGGKAHVVWREAGALPAEYFMS